MPMETNQPQVVVIAGPNGAGKSTTAPVLLQELFGISEFVNADIIAREISPDSPDRAALGAGRIMLTRTKELARLRRDFAFETTLATRHFAPWLADLSRQAYMVHVVFLWLPSPETAIGRVTERVRLGGHGVPPDTVRRRYARGLRNFFSLYRPIAAYWRFYDNSDTGGPRLIAAGGPGHPDLVQDAKLWGVISGEEREQD
jgi:predicted ABC-type ATPase